MSLGEELGMKTVTEEVLKEASDEEIITAGVMKIKAMYDRADEAGEVCLLYTWCCDSCIFCSDSDLDL